MENKKGKEMGRRDFLKFLGLGTAAVAGLSACTDSQNQKSLSSDAGSDGQMTCRQTPTTGDRVSLLGYGCMRWPLVDGKRDGEIDQQAVNELVDYAMAHGVNYYDTSPVYCKGFSERSTGIALSRYPRDKYFIATKMSNFDPSTHSLERSRAMYENSMKELQTDYFDYYLLHAVGNGGMEMLSKRYLDNGVLDFLLKEREAGRIRNLGWSFHGDVAVFDYLLSLPIRWDFVQIQLNYVDWKHASGRNVNAEYLYGELAKRNIPAVIMEPLLGGRLARLEYNSMHKLKQYRPDMTAASWAFRFAGHYPGVLTVLSGMTYMEHLQENLRTFSPHNPLTQGELDTLESVAQRILQFPYISCTGCQYCMPCPYGLDIPSIFTHYNKCLDEGNFPDNVQDENYRKARRAFLIGLDRKVPRERQADHCTGCGKCIPMCPQRIRIPQQLERIDAMVNELKLND